MSLINQIRNIGESLNKLFANPTIDGHFAIIDAEKEIDAFRKQLLTLKTETLLLEKKASDAKADVQKFQNIAAKAAAAKNEEDCRTAVTAKQTAEKKLAALERDIQSNHQIQANAEAQISTAETKINQAKNSEEQAKTRIKTATLRTNLANATDSFNSTSALSQIDALNQEADRAEAEATATEQLTKSTHTEKLTDLESKYNSTNSSVDDEVAKLFAKP
jgi:phage shock protein A